MIFFFITKFSLTNIWGCIFCFFMLECKLIPCIIFRKEELRQYWEISKKKIPNCFCKLDLEEIFCLWTSKENETLMTC